MIRKWKKLVFRFIQRFSSYLSSRIFETNSDTDENKHKNINNFNYSRAIQVNTEFLSHPRNVNRHFCVPDFTFITPSNLLTPSVSKSHRRKHHKRTIRFRGGKIRMSDGRRRRRRLEEWAERGEERERERREEGWRRRGKRGDGRDVSWRPTLRGKRSGLPGVPWETDRRRRKRVSPEEDEGLARRSCLLDPPQRIPCSVFSLSLSLSSLGRIRKESQLPSCKTATPRNKTRDIIIIGEVDPVAVNLSEEEGSLRYCCSSRKWILVSDLRIVRGRKIYNGREENISCSRLF